MVSVTLSVPEEIKRQMDRFSEINWSGFIRRMLVEKTKELSWKEEMLKELRKEEDLNNWAVTLMAKGRKNRFKELKEKRLV